MGLLGKLFGTTPKKKKKQIAPVMRYVVLGHGDLPSPLELFDPSSTGAPGAKLPGVLGPAPGEEKGFDIDRPLRPGTSLALHRDGAFALTLDEGRDMLRGLADIIEDAGAEPLARAQAATWAASIDLVVTEEGPMTADLIGALKASIEIADRLATVGNGILLDVSGYRVLLPGAWRTPEEEQIEGIPFDPREHFNIHAVDEGAALWLHSHGLVKLGKAELELRTTIRDEALQLLFFDILTGAALSEFQEGQTAGDPETPLRIVGPLQLSEGDEGHWQELEVLGLVDPGSNLADKGLRAMMEGG